VKITVTADGEVSFETEDIDQAIAMVARLRNGAKPAATKSHHKKPAPEPEPEPEPEVQVSAVLYQTWEWLVAHDRSEGTATHVIARELGLQVPTTGWRLKKLKAAGLAHQTKRGYWRPGER